jgi:hypothetical protein
MRAEAARFRAVRGIFALVSHTGRWPLAALAAAALIAGCGESQHRNGTRPASPVTITAVIRGKAVQVSPRSVGAGPIEFLVSNQSGRTQQLTFETDDTGGGPAGIRASTTVPLAGTAQLQVSPKSGAYVLDVRDRSVADAPIKIGPKRQSAQNVLLQP